MTWINTSTHQDLRLALALPSEQIDQLIKQRPWLSLHDAAKAVGVSTDVMVSAGVRLGWYPVVTLDMPILAYLQLCMAHGADNDGDCISSHWAAQCFDADCQMASLFDAFPDDLIEIDTAMFSLETMILFLDAPVRERFCQSLVKDPSRAVHAIFWKVLNTAVNTQGAPAPTELESLILRQKWHSSFTGKIHMSAFEGAP